MQWHAYTIYNDWSLPVRKMSLLVRVPSVAVNWSLVCMLAHSLCPVYTRIWPEDAPHEKPQRQNIWRVHRCDSRPTSVRWVGEEWGLQVNRASLLNTRVSTITAPHSSSCLITKDLYSHIQPPHKYTCTVHPCV